MGLAAVTETMELPGQKDMALTERDREFVAWFAFRTGDRELTEKLVGELLAGGGDGEAVRLKYRVLAGPAPAGPVQKAENLLVSLEMYRVLGEKAVKGLAELLSVCGTPAREDKAGRTNDAGTQETARKEMRL